MELVIFESQAGEAMVLRASGWIDETNAEQLKDKLLNLLKRGRKKLVVNLKNIAYVGTAGWFALMEFVPVINQYGGDIKLTDMNEDVHNFYTSMAFDAVLKSYTTEQEAVESFRAN